MKIHSTIKFLVFALLTLFISCDSDDIKPENRLVAIAGDDKASIVNQNILLDGSSSYDGNKEPFAYSWTVLQKPNGSVYNLQNSRQVKPNFSANTPGVYTIELTISQGQWTAKDQVIITLASAQPNDPNDPQDPTPPMAIVLTNNITTPTTLGDVFAEAERIDYFVENMIQVTADLTVAPGVVIAFKQNTSLEIIGGAIRAIGSYEKPITFRGATAQAGFWKGVIVYSNSEQNEFKFVTVKHAGSDVHMDLGIRASIAVAGSDNSGGAIRISNTTLADGIGYGLYLRGMATLHHFASNSFQNLSPGMSAYIPARQLHRLDLSSNVGLTEIETGGAVIDQSEVEWKAIPNGSYIVSSQLYLGVGTTLQPGVSLKSKNGVTINVGGNGYLKAIGTQESPITFTSAGTSVYWNGIFVNTNHPSNIIKYAEVSYGGLDRIADADQKGNIVVGRSGSLNISNTILKNGLGYGVVAQSIDHVNQDMISVNTFSSLNAGNVYPYDLYYPDRPALAGEWVDYWSFTRGYGSISENFYNRQAGVWFNGAANPWEMPTGNGMGIRFDENGGFTWLIGEQGPMTGCPSYNAEYITGTYGYAQGVVYFNQDYWRTKFYNGCDESQNVDLGVEPQQIQLSYTIEKMYNVWTGDSYWVLKFTNPDNSTFSFYRR